ncbi:hypothetical protein HPB51_022603 [Rhipicephalus microplus]|uniref:Uncharacterized protein n=1 Tax=Rhipicephalus microplus TaxID=6941 RepID=A0A9J6DX84_RHIMP|nr:hypothetical protein HPB51_022603 [Rhipicephalus microplus]
MSGRCLYPALFQFAEISEGQSRVTCFTAFEVQSTKEKHGDNGMFFIDDPQSDQAVEGSADFEDTDASSGIGDDEDAEGSGDEHLSEEEMGSGTVGPVFVTPKVTVVTDTKHPPKHSAKPKGPALNPEAS